MVRLKHLNFQRYELRRVFHVAPQHNTLAGFRDGARDKPLKRVDVALSVAIGLHIVLAPRLPEVVELLRLRLAVRLKYRADAAAYHAVRDDGDSAETVDVIPCKVARTLAENGYSGTRFGVSR